MDFEQSKADEPVVNTRNMEGQSVSGPAVV